MAKNIQSALELLDDPQMEEAVMKVLVGKYGRGQLIEKMDVLNEATFSQSAH